MTDERKDQLTAEADGLIEGRNAVIEALRTEASIDKIFIQKGEVDKTLGHIASKARAAGIVVVEADRRKLAGMSRTHAHQGVIALAAVREYVSVDDILADACGDISGKVKVSLKEKKLSDFEQVRVLLAGVKNQDIYNLPVTDEQSD